MDEIKSRRYASKITDQQILSLLESGAYRVDLDTGEIFNKSGKQLKIFYDMYDRFFVRLYIGRQARREISVCKLVWIAGTKSVVPDGFEVHHRDTYKAHNSFDNLICLHRIDHQKFHDTNKSLYEELIPF